MLWRFIGRKIIFAKSINTKLISLSCINNEGYISFKNINSSFNILFHE
ncbi:hypothetical protein ECSTEC7V_0244 [Escherichia coli STEC_7v]|nr:hypothetical protein ECSTEC7V_0244 [Escherichia coli STEC_7v]